MENTGVWSSRFTTVSLYWYATFLGLGIAIQSISPPWDVGVGAFTAGFLLLGTA